MQVIFAESTSKWATPEYDRAAAGIDRLLPAFGDRTIFTRFVAPAEPKGAWVPYYALWPFALVPHDDRLYDLTEQFRDRAPHVETRETFGKWDAAFAAAMGGSTEMVITGRLDRLLRHLDRARGRRRGGARPRRGRRLRRAEPGRPPARSRRDGALRAAHRDHQRRRGAGVADVNRRATTSTIARSPHCTASRSATPSGCRRS